MINITKLENGSVKINDTSLPAPKYFNNLTEVQVVQTKSNQITVTTNKVTFTFDYDNVGTVNEVAKPATIGELAELLAEDVFNFRGSVA